MVITEIIKYIWSAWFGSKTFYGVSTDNSVQLEELPRKYPSIDDKFKIQTDVILFKVVEIKEADEKIVIVREDNTKAFDVDIELFEELFTPVDEQQNYPL